MAGEVFLDAEETRAFPGRRPARNLERALRLGCLLKVTVLLVLFEWHQSGSASGASVRLDDALEAPEAPLGPIYQRGSRRPPPPPPPLRLPRSKPPPPPPIGLG